MTDPQKMCRKHLLGEHVECHMFAGSIKRGKNIRGYIRKGLVEIHNIKKRHDELAGEMQRRGYNHNSPLEFVSSKKEGKINSQQNSIELCNRCADFKSLNLPAG